MTVLLLPVHVCRPTFDDIMTELQLLRAHAGPARPLRPVYATDPRPEVDDDLPSGPEQAIRRLKTAGGEKLCLVGARGWQAAAQGHLLLPRHAISWHGTPHTCARCLVGVALLGGCEWLAGC